jgi:hypothetical protein
MFSVLHGDRNTVTAFFLDPSTDPIVIRLVQLYGKVAILTPLFQAARIMLYSEDPHLGGIVYGIKRS